MIDEDHLFDDPDPQFEESIRIDRDLKVEDDAEERELLYQRYLDDYHLTDATVDFLEELFNHFEQDTPDADERNHWLYGYYGSGKSHLLTALDLLLDTPQVEAHEGSTAWERFDDKNAEPELGEQWHSLHDDTVIVPISINLLQYQGVREQSFSEIVLQEVYKQRGLGDRLAVAFFEEEFKRTGGMFDTREVWDQRDELLNDILADEGVSNPDYDWNDVRQYQLLSDIVLPDLTERATGMVDNLADIQNKKIGQELAVRKIESYRQELEDQYDRPVKIALLMDEVTLFIGGNYQRLSELNALAEGIKDVGEGNIISVVTAQSEIEDVQPGLAVKQLNFGILKDRFPQQYELPSRHAGEIVQQRLLAKSDQGAQWIENNALTATVDPKIMLTYREVGQNTAPPLDGLDEEQFSQYYPLLPYQPALFMEILSNLRELLPDATKSIFSGTARAVLALVAGLRAEWTKKEGDMPVISLVDFYDLVQYELQDIIQEKTDVIDDIENDPETDAFDLKVAKSVLLLSYVPEMIPQSDSNIATAVMDDLEGEIRSNVQNRVRASLEGSLEKYIRPDTSTDGADLRLTDREEQRLISDAREYETDPEWDEVIESLDEYLWENIVAELGLPTTYDWGTDGEDTAYPVGYSFDIDGASLETGYSDSESTVFDVDVVIRGLHPDVDTDRIDQDKLYWKLDTEGIEELRAQLAEWWALEKATSKTNPPESVVRDRSDAANRVTEKLKAALSNGDFTVRANDFTTSDNALSEYVNETYPDYFHPELARISESHLDELRQLDDDPLPSWADTIGVPAQSTGDIATFGDIAFEVRRLIGTQIQESGDGVDVATILDRAIEEEPLFSVETPTGQDPSPAMLAVLWGLCRAGVFRITTVDGEPVELNALLNPHKHTTITLSTVPVGPRAKDVFVEHDIIEPTESENQGYINFVEELESIETRANGLKSDASVKADTTFETAAVNMLVHRLATTARDIAEEAADRQDDATTVDTDTLEAIIEATEEDRETLDMAETHWEERLPFLLQLEGLIRPELREVAWLSEDVHAQLQTLTDQVGATTDTDWWTDDGWRDFVDDVDARSQAIELLTDAWADQQAKTGVESLQTELEGHPWLLGPGDLPPTIRDGFKSTYVDPLRTFRTTVDRVTTTFTGLSDPEPGTQDTSTLTGILGWLDNTLEWECMTETTVEQRRELLTTLDRVVDGKAPADLTGVGLLHTDADVLKAHIESLEAEDLELLDVDGGVIVR